MRFDKKEQDVYGINGRMPKKEFEWHRRLSAAKSCANPEELRVLLEEALIRKAEVDEKIAATHSERARRWVNNPEDSICFEALSNPAMPEDVLVKHLLEGELHMRRSAAFNPKTPLKPLRAVLENENDDPDVRSAACQALRARRNEWPDEWVAEGQNRNK